MSSANRTTDNKHFHCPPRMDDGRHFTDFRSNCHFNNLVRANNAVMNSHDYRMFLTNNARGLMELNRSYACQKNGCGPRPGKEQPSTMLPEQTMQICNNKSCNVEFVNKNGLGQGRKYDQEPIDCPAPTGIPVNQPYNCSADNGKPFNYYNQVDSDVQGNLSSEGNANAVRQQGKVPAAFNL